MKTISKEEASRIYVEIALNGELVVVVAGRVKHIITVIFSESGLYLIQGLN